MIVGQWLQQPGWTWTCVSWPWTSNPLPPVPLARQKEDAFGQQARSWRGKCERGYSQVLWAGFNICGRWGFDRRIIASGLVTDGAGLSVNHGQAKSSVKDIFTAVISLSELHNVNQRQSCRWRNFCAALWSSFCADQLPHDQLSKTFHKRSSSLQQHSHTCVQSVLDNQIWSLIGSLSWTIIPF